MEYKQFGDDYVVRIQRGEEILTVITQVCDKEHITLGTIQGIGAVGEVTLGIFSREQFKYLSQTYSGDFEIASCSGNISTMAGKTYLHVHMVVGNVIENKLYGGHLNRGVISLTGEFILHKLPGTVDRAYSPEVGLNLFKF